MVYRAVNPLISGTKANDNRNKRKVLSMKAVLINAALLALSLVPDY